jgi:hypothetical protein
MIYHYDFFNGKGAIMSDGTSSANITANTPASINKLMFSVGPVEYYTTAFRQVLEDHMAYLRTSSTTQTVSVSPQDAWAFDQDLYGYLQQRMAMGAQYHWATMRLNNMISRTQFGAHVKQLLIPSPTLLEQIRSAYLTSSTISS